MGQKLIFKFQIAFFEFENEKNRNRPLPNDLNYQIRKVLMWTTLCLDVGWGTLPHLSKIFQKNQDRPLPNDLNY